MRQKVQSGPQQGVVNNLPVVLSAWDVVSWIAFRELQPRPDFPDAVDFTLKWGCSDATQTLAALEARSSDAPFCIWEPLAWDGEPWDGDSYKHVAWSPNGPKMLRWIVRQLNTKHRRIVTFREAAGILQSGLEAFQLFNVRTDEAKRELVEALRAGKLTAWGKRDLGRGALDPVAEYKEIERRVFWDELVSVTDWGKVDANPADQNAIMNYQGSTFREVRFEAEDVLRLWPGHECSGVDVVVAVAPAKAVQRPQRVNRGGRPAAWDWDAFIREVVRLANSVDGLPSRADLQRHMLEWCELTWGKSPADSTVRDQIAQIYPE